jgi:transposase
MRYELTDQERTAIKPMLPNKPRGLARANDRHVNWLLQSVGGSVVQATAMISNTQKLSTNHFSRRKPILPT